MLFLIVFFASLLTPVKNDDIFRRKFTITLNEGKITLHNPGEFLFEINTLKLIGNGKMDPLCQNIRFVHFINKENYTSSEHLLLPHYLEGGCGRKNTMFWINITLEALYKMGPIEELVGFFYYSPDSTSMADFSESEYVFEGKFNLLFHDRDYVNTKDCPSQWTQNNGMVDRFVKVTSYESENYNLDGQNTHTHRIVGSSGSGGSDSGYDSQNAFGITKSRYCTDSSHTHEFDTYSHESENSIKFFSFLLCENEFLDIEPQVIVFFNNDFSFLDTDSNWNIMKETYGSYLKIGENSGDTQPYVEHGHSFELNLINDDSSSVEVEGWESNHNYPGATHVHTVSTKNSDYQPNEDNYPEYFTVRLGSAKDQDVIYPEAGMIVGCSKKPPLGWDIFEKADGKYLRSNSIYESLGGSPSHVHDFTGGTSEEDVLVSVYSSSWAFNGPSCIDKHHSHTVSGSFSPATNEVENFKMLLCQRRGISGVVINIESEEIPPVPECLNCSEHGNCVDKSEDDFQTKCECHPGYNGSDCSIALCPVGYCFEQGGHCNSPDHCVCKKSKLEKYENITYLGSRCEYWKCFGFFSHNETVCSNGNGTCEGPNECSCNANRTGDMCERWECFGVDMIEEDACSGNGNCSFINECECDDGYFGENCEKWECYGIGKDESSVCGGHGSCISYNECSCDANYTGDTCEDWMCRTYLINSTMKGNETRWVHRNDTLACNKNGSCVGFDECKCNNVYTDDLCSEYSCYLFSYKDFASCSGDKGICLSHDNCSCDEFFIGKKCESWTCNGTERTNASVCNGHGECFENNICVCNEPYTGDFCDKWKCNNVQNDLKKVCNSRGKCLETGKCQCYSDREGDDCETLSTGLLIGIFVLVGFIVVILLMLLIVCLMIVIIFRDRIRNLGKKIKAAVKLDDVEVLLEEQKMSRDSTIAKFNINKALFEIDINDIEIKQKIGQGGSGTVIFKVIWNKKEYAFKVFKVHPDLGQDAFTAFEKEVELLSSIRFPSILDFYGAVLAENRLGFVMQYCEHGDIRCFLEKHKKEYYPELYPIKEKINWLYEISSAMEFIHSKNIIHRDLKPENVLLDDNLRVKLMDFGCSRIDVDNQNSEKTMRIGTCYYMAPEIVLSTNYDSKVDVYSFGILTWVILTENFDPFGGIRNVELRVANESNFRPDVSYLPKNTPEWLKELMIMCWDSMTEARPTFSQVTDIIKAKAKLEVEIKVEEDDYESIIKDLKRQLKEKDKIISDLKMKYELNEIKKKKIEM